MNSKYFEKFYTDRNLRKSTIDGYIVSLKLYSNCNNEHLDNLILEAFNDEKKNIHLKNRKIKRRLLNYRNFLIKKNMSKNTIKTYFSKVKTFYKHFEIEIPILPIVKYKTDYQLNYYDLPKKTDILKVISIVPLDMKALILFMSSSGTSKSETLSLTVNDFIKGCSDYFTSDYLESILYELSLMDNVVPTIYLKRIKTDKYYYTFCSPEATMYIVKYLRTRESLSLNDKLFPFSKSSLTIKFQRINDHMGWGKRGHYRFFRSHTLRKFHASNIGLPAEYIDALQGRQKNKIHETYIKTNPKELKKYYMDNMDNVRIFPKVKKEEHSEDIHITINIFLSDMYLSL